MTSTFPARTTPTPTSTIDGDSSPFSGADQRPADGKQLPRNLSAFPTGFLILPNIDYYI